MKRSIRLHLTLITLLASQSSYAINGEAVPMQQIPQGIQNLVKVCMDGGCSNLSSGSIKLKDLWLKTNQATVKFDPEGNSSFRYVGNIYLKDGVMYPASQRPSPPYIEVANWESLPSGLTDLSGEKKIQGAANFGNEASENIVSFRLDNTDSLKINAVGVDGKEMSSTDFVKHMGEMGEYRETVKSDQRQIDILVSSEGGAEPQAKVTEVAKTGTQGMSKKTTYELPVASASHP